VMRRRLDASEPRRSLGPRRVPAGVERDEVAVARHLDQIRRELRGPAKEARRIDELLDDVPRMAAAKAEVLLAIVREDLAHSLGLVLDVLTRADALEDLVILLDRRRLYVNFIADAAEKRLVDEIGWDEGRSESV